MIRSNVGKPRGILGRRAGGSDGNDARFSHLRQAPSAALAEHVAHFWIVGWDLRGHKPHLAETLPHPSVHITIERRSAQIGGVNTGKFSRKLTGLNRVFGIKLRPGVFRSLYKEPLSRLTNRKIPIEELFGSAGRELARAIRGEADERRCIELAENFLLPRLLPLSPTVVMLRDLVERMAIDRSLQRVEQVAALANMDLRRLQRLFSEHVGVGPKWVIQRYRLHEAAEQLGEGNPLTLAALAQELGYFDQAHFIRDFKSVVGRPPGREAAKKR